MYTYLPAYVPTQVDYLGTYLGTKYYQVANLRDVLR